MKGFRSIWLLVMLGLGCATEVDLEEGSQARDASDAEAEEASAAPSDSRNEEDTMGQAVEENGPVDVGGQDAFATDDASAVADNAPTESTVPSDEERFRASARRLLERQNLLGATCFDRPGTLVPDCADEAIIAEPADVIQQSTELFECLSQALSPAIALACADGSLQEATIAAEACQASVSEEAVAAVATQFEALSACGEERAAQAESELRDQLRAFRTVSNDEAAACLLPAAHIIDLCTEQASLNLQNSAETVAEHFACMTERLDADIEASGECSLELAERVADASERCSLDESLRLDADTVLDSLDQCSDHRRLFFRGAISNRESARNLFHEECGLPSVDLRLTTCASDIEIEDLLEHREAIEALLACQREAFRDSKCGDIDATLAACTTDTPAGRVARRGVDQIDGRLRFCAE